HVKDWPGETLLTGRDGGQLPPWALERAVRTARGKVDGLPEGFRYHGPAPLLRLTPDRLWHRRQDRPGAAAARERQDDARHLRAPAGSPAPRPAAARTGPCPPAPAARSCCGCRRSRP